MSKREPLKFKVCVLLDTFGSCPVVATVKVIELPVVLVGMTTTLSVFDPLAAKPPGTLQVNLPPVLFTAGMTEQDVPSVATDWNLAFAGKVASSVATPAAVLPTLWIFKLMVMAWLTTRLFAVLILATRSMTGVGVGVAVAGPLGTAVGVRWHGKLPITPAKHAVAFSDALALTPAKP